MPRLSCWDPRQSFSKDVSLAYTTGNLSNHLLEKITQQNANRQNEFICMVFTPDQCRTLVASRANTNLEVFECRFEDVGAAFMFATEAPHWSDPSGKDVVQKEFVLGRVYMNLNYVHLTPSPSLMHCEATLI